MNEIDFTLAPSDVSLSRCYQTSASTATNAKKMASTSISQKSQSLQEQQRQRVQTQSLTRALNTASNRALRRILLARSWPSAEALNMSLRTVLKQEQEATSESKGELKEVENDAAKCPVPRPILNILMRRRDAKDGEEVVSSSDRNPTPRSSAEKEKDWIANQVGVFRESYGDLPGYDEAEAYLECILSLATSGEESVRVNEVSNY